MLHANDTRFSNAQWAYDNALPEMDEYLVPEYAIVRNTAGIGEVSISDILDAAGVDAVDDELYHLITSTNETRNHVVARLYGVLDKAYNKLMHDEAIRNADAREGWDD